MIVRTNTQIVLDNQIFPNPTSELYFVVENKEESYEFDTIRFMVKVFKNIQTEENGDPILSLWRVLPASYKSSTFYTLFGETTLNNFKANMNTLMIQEISYNNAKWFGLTSTDLEIYSGNYSFV